VNREAGFVPAECTSRFESKDRRKGLGHLTAAGSCLCTARECWSRGTLRQRNRWRHRVPRCDAGDANGKRLRKTRRASRPRRGLPNPAFLTTASTLPCPWRRTHSQPRAAYQPGGSGYIPNRDDIRRTTLHRLEHAGRFRHRPSCLSGTRLITQLLMTRSIVPSSTEAARFLLAKLRIAHPELFALISARWSMASGHVHADGAPGRAHFLCSDEDIDSCAEQDPAPSFRGQPGECRRRAAAEAQIGGGNMLASTPVYPSCIAGRRHGPLPPCRRSKRSATDAL